MLKRADVYTWNGILNNPRKERGIHAMQTKLTPVLETLLAVAKKAQKAYCYPSQRRILLLLVKFHKLHISRRTLNRYLKALEADHFFTRVRRHRKGPTTVNPITGAEGPPRILFASTLYKIGARSFNWVADGLARAQSFFSFFRVPKLAQYKSASARYGSHSGQLDRLRSLVSPIGGASGAASCGLSPPPNPAK